MRKPFKTLFALACAAVLLGCMGFSSRADDPGEAGDTEDSIVLSCTEIPLYVDDNYIGSGILVNSVTYVPLLAFTEYMLQDDCKATWDQETGTATISSGVLRLSLTMGNKYMAANDRYLYLEDGAYNINGTIVVPIRALAKIFNLEVWLDTESWAIFIDGTNSSVLQNGAYFYDESDLYWLSHVINAEAANQPLEGMIGVGNVVLNRLNDEDKAFGNSLYAIIFAPNQFDVVPLGTIYCEPNEESVIAAKLCLEGYNTVGNSLWFLNPRTGSSYWFNTYKVYNLTIADHAFYT